MPAVCHAHLFAWQDSLSIEAKIWLTRIFQGRDAAGKRLYVNETVHGTKKQAETRLIQLLRDRDQGIAIKPAAIRAEEYLSRWLDEAARPKLRAKTYLGYKSILESYVRPAFGFKPLSKVTPLDIQGLYNALHQRGLSPRTIQYTNMILKQAFKWRMLVFNPCEGVELPKQQRKEMQYLPPEAIARFLAAAKLDRYSAVFEIAVTSGMRPSEYLALKWPDIDFQRGMASVIRSLDSKAKGGWESISKSKNLFRCIISSP